jgi:hypothetical protein
LQLDTIKQKYLWVKVPSDKTFSFSVDLGKSSWLAFKFVDTFVVYIGYTAIAAYSAQFMQEPLQSKIHALTQQLELVKRITDSEFWLATEELCTLLELDDSTLDTLKTKEV